MSKRAKSHLAEHLSLSHPGWLIRRLLVDDLRRASPLVQGRVLDVGCGQSPYRVLFPKLSGYVGIDHPNVHHPENRPSAWADGLHLPFAPNSFDAVLATQVLEHVPEPVQLLAEIGRVLRPGGVLLLSAPHIWELHEQPHDYFRYTRYGLEYLLRQAGFDPERIVAQGGLFVMLAQRSSYFAFRVLRRLRLQPLAIAAAFVINQLGRGLDRLYRYEGDTLNYLAVARKRECAPHA